MALGQIIPTVRDFVRRLAPIKGKISFVHLLPGLGGDGQTTGTRLSGWDSVINADTTGRSTYTFVGYFSTANTIKIQASHIDLIGAAGNEILYTGGANALVADARADGGGGDVNTRYNYLRFDGLHINGNNTMRKGIRIDNVHHSSISRCSVYNFETSSLVSIGFELLFNIECNYSSLFCTPDANESGNMPAIGVMAGTDATPLMFPMGTPTGGTYTVAVTTLVGTGAPVTQTTAAINWTDTAAQIATKIAALSNVGVGKVAGVGTTFSNGLIAMTFDESLGIVKMVRANNSLTGTTPDIGMKGYSNTPQCQCGCKFSVIDIEGCRVYGLYGGNFFSCEIMGSAFATTISGGQYDIFISDQCHDNNLMGVDFEGTKGCYNNGRDNLMRGCDGGTSPYTFGPLSVGNVLSGGICAAPKDDGTHNTVDNVHGVLIDTVTKTDGTFNYTNRFADNTSGYAWQVCTALFKNGVIDFKDYNTAGGVSPSYIRTRQNRSGHTQEWWVGMGNVGFGSYAIYDATGSKTVIEIKENAGGLFILNGMTVDTLTVSGNISVTGNYGGTLLVKQTTTTPAVVTIYSNTTGAGQAYVEYKMDRTSFVRTWHVGMGEISGSDWGAYDVTGNRVLVQLTAAGSVNLGDASTGNINLNRPLVLASYTVATLPTGSNGMKAYASNGRKVGEGAAAGTGVAVYFSNTAWRVPSTDAAVAA